jgi:hypothetical protein
MKKEGERGITGRGSLGTSDEKFFELIG